MGVSGTRLRYRNTQSGQSETVAVLYACIVLITPTLHMMVLLISYIALLSIGISIAIGMRENWFLFRGIEMDTHYRKVLLRNAHGSQLNATLT